MRPALSAADALWILRTLWPKLADVVNSPEDPRAPGEKEALVRCLERLLEGKLPLPGGLAEVTLGLYGQEDGSLAWSLVTGGGRDPRSSGFRLTLMLLWHPRARGLLRRCAGCRAFILREQRRRSVRDFCREACRSALRRSPKGRRTISTAT